MSLSSPTLRQRQTMAAREAFAELFRTPEEKSAHFRELGRRSADRRIVLSGEEAEALVVAYELLGRIAQRATPSNPPPPENEVAAGGEPAAGKAA